MALAEREGRGKTEALSPPMATGCPSALESAVAILDLAVSDLRA
jgi:hypothetical protein